MIMSLRWFPVAYLSLAFFFIPAILIGITTMIGEGGGLAVVGWIILVLIAAFLSIYLYWYYKMGGKDRVAKYLREKKKQNTKVMLWRDDAIMDCYE